jgi:hypothetical protein
MGAFYIQKLPNSPNSWQILGLYYKTFYISNCYRIAISKSICHFLSLPPLSTICGQD